MYLESTSDSTQTHFTMRVHNLNNSRINELNYCPKIDHEIQFRFIQFQLILNSSHSDLFSVWEFAFRGVGVRWNIFEF